MLVLSRQRDETIMIGDDIEVTIVDIRGDKVRLGINAPKNLTVHRKEVYEQIKRENREAAQVSPVDVAGIKLPPPPAVVTEPAKSTGKPGAKVGKRFDAVIEVPLKGGTIPFPTKVSLPVTAAPKSAPRQPVGSRPASGSARR